MSLPIKESRPVRPLFVDLKRLETGRWDWRVRCGKTGDELAHGSSDQIAKAYTSVTLTLTDLAHGTGKFAQPQRALERLG